MIFSSFNANFLRASTVLLNGVFLAHFIGLIGTLYLANIYGPTAFIQLAQFTSICSLFMSVACLRYDVAVSMAGTITEQVRVLSIALIVALIFSLTIFFLGLLYKLFEVSFDMSMMPSYFFLIPCSILFGAAIQALHGFLNRQGLYGLVSKVRIGQSLLLVMVPIISSYFIVDPIALIAGQVISVAFACLILMRFVIKQPDINWRKKPSIARLWETSKKFKKFPIYSVPEAFLNSASTQTSILLLSTLFMAPAVGVFFLAYRLLLGPIQIASLTIGQAYMSKATYMRDKGTLGLFTIRLASILFLLGAIGVAVIYYISYLYADSLLGNEWAGITSTIGILSPWIVMQITVSPISTILHVIGRTEIMTRLSIFGLIIRVGAIMAAYFIDDSNVVLFFSASSAIYYLVSLVTFMWFIFRKRLSENNSN